MARRKSPLRRVIRPKAWAFALFRSASRLHHQAPYWLGFFSTVVDPGSLPGEILEKREVPHALGRPEFRTRLKPFEERSWDVIQEDEEAPQSVSRVLVGKLGGMLVPGHTLTPVHRQSLAQVSLWQPRTASWNFAKPAPIIWRRIEVEGLAAVVPPIRHYGHLMTDVLLPLAHAVERGALIGERLTVTTRAGRPPPADAFVEGLASMGFEARLMELKGYEHAVPERLLVASQRSGNHERSHVLAGAVQFAKRVFEAGYAARPRPRPSGGRLYLTRGMAKLWQLKNEDEVVAALRTRGFEVFEARWSNHDEQIARFAATELVVGVHGAGLVNLIWCRSGAEVVEILPDDFRKTTFLHMSAEHGLGYTPFFGSKEGHNQAFTVDVPALTALVDRCLEARERSLQ